MSGSDFGRDLSAGGGACARHRLSPARLRIRHLRRLIRLRRKRRRAGQAPEHAAGVACAPRASAPGLVALFALGAVVAAGCGWYGTEHSVRFNRWRSERPFTRLPPLPFDARERTKPDYRLEEDGREYEAAEGRVAGANALWPRAEEAALRGDFALLRKLLNEYLEATDPGFLRGHYEAPVRWRQRRNSARDQLDALDSLGRGSGAEAVSSYLGARRAFDHLVNAQDVSAEDDADPGAAAESGAARAKAVTATLDEVPREAGLEDNVAYLRAALLAEGGERGAAVEAFERLAARHARSEKREAALFNAALLWMRGDERLLGVEHAAADEACPECKGEAWAKASAAFGRVLREHPRGRYAGDARGWLAFLHVRVGERAEGLAEYYRMLAHEQDPAARDEAVRSLRLVRGRATEDEMTRVESLLEGEPRAALAYAYHEIYNAALGDGFDVEPPEDGNPYEWCQGLEDASNCSGAYYKWQEEERGRLEHTAERRSFERVAAYATRLMRGSADASAGGAFALRVAQADLELGDDRGARELAARALSAGLAGDERAAALWVRGAAEYRLGESSAARRTFAALLAEFPEGDLAEGARRYSAMAAEAEGDLGAALEHYLALDYEEDVAYFVDVLMTPEQLAAFAERSGGSKAADMLFYSLGVRHMRAHRFDEARAAYARVRTDGTPDADADSNYQYLCRQDYAPPECKEVKNPRSQWRKGVRAEWVLRDLKTMEEMEHLEARLGRAEGDEERAEALYQLAGYLYESGELAFYNPAAWRGGRFGALYYDQQFRAPGEAALMRRYMEEHEPLARALSLYLRVADEYPRTRAARDSLYTAAVIHERLKDFALYWPGQYEQGLYPGARLVTYADVRRTYPDYRLPAGTYGWEPASRTVNGHAAWPAPPKPRQLTGAERARARVRRVERRAALAWALFGEVYGGRVRAWTVKGARWAFAALVACAVLLVFRRTRRARRFLYRRFARRRRARPTPSDARATRAPKCSYAAHVARPRGAGLTAAAAEGARGLLRLALHERARAALALNLFTHALLTVLLWAVLWAAR